MVCVWRTTGLYMVYFLAGLQSIPKDLYEAAKLDGASKMQCFFYITIPMLRPVTVFVVVILTIHALQIFDESFILNTFSMHSNAGPGNAGLTLPFYLYKLGFEEFKLGYAASLGVFMFVLIFVVSIIQLKVLGLFKNI